MIETTTPLFRLRSFIRRDSRKTPAQERARVTLWPSVGIVVAPNQLLSYPALFGRDAPVFIEIGFGSGQSLLALAQHYPQYDFIGVETYKPGIGALCQGIQQAQLTNVRIYDGDAIDLFTKHLPPSAATGMQLFFPDPWPKRRHHARRLIQPNTLDLLLAALQNKGQLHLATDWEDYAHHMMRVLSASNHLINMAGTHQFATRSWCRPILTKFEKRALTAGRAIWELQFTKEV